MRNWVVSALRPTLQQHRQEDAVDLGDKPCRDCPVQCAREVMQMDPVIAIQKHHGGIRTAVIEARGAAPAEYLPVDGRACAGQVRDDFWGARRPECLVHRIAAQ